MAHVSVSPQSERASMCGSSAGNRYLRENMATNYLLQFALAWVITERPHARPPQSGTPKSVGRFLEKSDMVKLPEDRKLAR
jgi:hypothetical protein